MITGACALESWLAYSQRIRYLSFASSPVSPLAERACEVRVVEKTRYEWHNTTGGWARDKYFVIVRCLGSP